jgi:hypothetical protein
LLFAHGDEEIYNDLTVARDRDRVVIAFEGAIGKRKEWPAMRPIKNQVDFRSPDLHFQLVKRARESSFVIARYGNKYSGSDYFFEGKSFLMTKPYINTGFGDPTERMETTEFELKGMRREPMGEESLVRLEYKNRAPNGQEFEGWVDFDPDHNWVVRRCSQRQTANPANPAHLSTFELKVDYRLVDSTHYLPVRIERNIGAVESRTLQRDLVEYDEIIVGPPDESLFRLSGYGLPDVPLRPLTVASGPSLLGNGWFWGSLVAGALSLAALVFSRSRRGAASGGEHLVS